MNAVRLFLSDQRDLTISNASPGKSLKIFAYELSPMDISMA